MGRVLLSTAIVSVKHHEGHFIDGRALLDNASMSHFITRRLCQKLRLKLKRINYTIGGVGDSEQLAKYMTHITIQSKYSNFQATIACLVLESITSNIPLESFEKGKMQVPAPINLADPAFNIARPIDLLLGSNIFWNVLGSKHLEIPNSRLVIHETSLGWVFGGSNEELFMRTNSLISASKSTGKLHDELKEMMKKFWEIEEVNRGPFMSKDNQFCEQFFQETVKRDKEGKFIVKVPFRKTLDQLGNSRDYALKSFYALEKRLIKDPNLYERYVAFMQDYLDMGHMTEILDNEQPEELSYYIPHHAVLKEDSLTTKLRVVFNASRKSDSGLSLNDVQYQGPILQNDIFNILINFRLHNFVMSADVSKMYRMIWLDPDDRRFHRIFWRFPNEKEVKCYQLNTVTYGTASAPYLAIRCLRKLAEENFEKNPAASRVIERDFFLDDLLSGAFTDIKLLQLQRSVSEILASAGMELRKWLCNDADLQNQFSVPSSLEYSTLQLGEGQASKTLGVQWDARRDIIKYSSKISEASSDLLTKRIILSQVSQIFDPLGLLGPVILRGKLIIQKLWSEKLDWDDEIDVSIKIQWRNFREDLENLKSIEIPRQATTKGFTETQLHGFGDASEKAYGVAIYMRSKDPGGKITARLLCAKSKVAPLKKISLPRLELCSALLVAELMKEIKDNINIDTPISCHYWSDSTDALGWIRGCPSRWKTFVANRVSQIQSLSNKDDWNHVASQENPADIISRGSTIKDLINSRLWWEGPEWLCNNNAPASKLCNYDFSEEMRKEEKIIVAVTCEKRTEFPIFDRFSSYSRLVRVTAYLFRFYTQCKNKIESKRSTTLQPCEPHKLPNLSVKEIIQAEESLVKLVQRQSFTYEYNSLSNGRSIEKSSRLLCLNPVMSESGIILTGGRLSNSDLPFAQKHPMILPPDHNFTKLLCEHLHKELHHCGPTLLLTAAREKFWIIHGRSTARNVVRKCNTCFRFRPTEIPYKMGDLPKHRVRRYYPFLNVGVDYAGPFHFKDRKTRNPRLTKGYVCLFVCLATKAVHLETVSDLTVECFLACLRRFVSRRGKPSNLYSDNAGNFTGTSKELKELFEFLKDHRGEIYDAMAQQHIAWHFNPPRSPHFGGIWEAGIKNVKHHLKRTIGNANLHFEDFNSILTQIEAILNSRPLCPLSTDPENFEPLTPGHFLIGRSLISLPDREDYRSTPDNRLTLYERQQKVIQHFWDRWRKEYLHELQPRVKWQINCVQQQKLLKPGVLVIVKEKDTPPNQWPLGRIVELFPGDDGIVRVVAIKYKADIKGKTGKIIRRSVKGVCVLPHQ